MAKKLTITEARSRLSGLPEELRRNQVAKITRRDKPVLAIMRWDDYCGLVETLEIMSDEEALKQVRQGIADIEAGRVIPWEEAQKRLGL